MSTPPRPRDDETGPETSEPKGASGPREDRDRADRGPASDPPRPDRRPRVTVALPEGELGERVVEPLEEAGVDVEPTAAPEDIRQTLSKRGPDVVVIRSERPEVDAVEIVDALESRDEGPEVVVVSDGERPEERARLLAAGAARVISEESPAADVGELVARIASAVSEGGLDGPEVGGNPAQPRLADFLSRSPAMRDLVDTVRRVADSDSSLLITGETGVGKERLARAIHAEGPRASGPFVAVNCGVLAESLLESELFGHVRGAFTGAVSDRTGRFEQAEGGSIFLDEIGDMPVGLQVKLLTVLQRREIQRLGDEATQRVNVRVMAATHRELQELVAAGEFREDLYYRLNVVPLRIPPLRERREDLTDLVGSFVGYFRLALDKREVTGISADALRALLQHEFPGNIRELLNVIERAMLLCRGDRIERRDLPEEIREGSRSGIAAAGTGPATASTAPRTPASSFDPRDEAWLDRPLRDARRAVLDEFERAYLSGLLRRTDGAVGKTAELAGISPRSLYDKMRRHGLRKEDFRP